MAKTYQIALKWLKMALFALLHLIHPLFFLKLGQNVEAIVPNIKPLPQTFLGIAPEVIMDFFV